MEKVLVIIPAYNEAENICRVVDNLISKFPLYDYVVVNDGSKDDTRDICRKKKYNLLDIPVNLGLEGAFRAGMKYAFYNKYDYAVQLDGDGQHNPEYIQKMLECAMGGKDIVIGSRMEKEKNLRMLGARVITWCIKLKTKHQISDPTSGMRLYNFRVIKAFAQNNNYAPEPDTIAFLMTRGIKVGECEVCMNERMFGKSYLNITNSIKYMVKVVCAIMLLNEFRKE